MSEKHERAAKKARRRTLREERRDERQAMMRATICAEPHRAWTYKDLALALGRARDNTLSRDLSAVRRRVRDRDGGIITNCAYDEALGAQAFRYLPVDDDRGMSSRPLIGQARQANTRMRNLGDQAAYTAMYAPERFDRTYAECVVGMSDAVQQLQSVFGKIDDLAREREAERKRERKAQRR